MSLITSWGYTLSDADALPAILTEEEFNQLTAGKYSGDIRIPPNISAASTAVRNYCGWHVSPSLSCVFKERLLFENGRIKRLYDHFTVQLPATYVSEVTAVRLENEQFGNFAMEGNRVYLFDVPLSKVTMKTLIEVEYTAGVPPEMLAGVRELLAHRVTHALASSAGVQSETAGGVSITYSANWINSSRSTALADDNKEVLEPYRLRGVF